MKPTDIRIEEVRFSCEDFRYRTPLKFGGMALDRVTLLNVQCRVCTRQGRSAWGFGSMPLGNVWAFPSRRLGYQATLAAMQAVADRAARLFGQCTESGHPIDLAWLLQPELEQAAVEVAREQQLGEPIPHLATLVAASPFDAAAHDAFGKVHGRSCYETYGPDFLSHDLGHYLGPEFAGETLDRHVLRKPRPRMPLYHLVGALDPLTPAEVSQPVGDGLPETLGEWIRFNGLTHLKVKLNGDDLAWDVERVLGVERVAAEVQSEHGVSQWHYSLDFNERCPNEDYLLDFLHGLRERSPEGFARIAYIEQPTSRDLKADQTTMHQAARLCPVVIDEALIDLESLRVARAKGYSGAALKACKGQSQTLLLAAAAQRDGLFLCVQDLTCPGASLIQSAGLAAHIPTVSAIEANARQYVPAANAGWAERFPGLFQVRDGALQTEILTGPGLGAMPGEGPY